MNVGDEGGFAPNVDNAQQAIELIMTAIQQSNLDGKYGIAIDVAASEFFVTENGKEM